MLNAWVELLASTELPSTPRVVASLLTIVVVSYALRLGIVTTTRVNALIAVVSILPLYVIGLGAAPDIDISRLLRTPSGPVRFPGSGRPFSFARADTTCCLSSRLSQGDPCTGRHTSA